jgi:hypothetical protein
MKAHESVIVQRVGRDLQRVTSLIKRLMWTYRSAVTDKELKWAPSTDGSSLDKDTDLCEEENAKIWSTELELPAREWTRVFLKRHGL